MSLTGPQAFAARILVQWPIDHVARLADLDSAVLPDYEAGGALLGEEQLIRLRAVLEGGGALFLMEDGDGGRGVRLKFTTRDVRAINRLESEGGPVGSDDV